MSISSPERRTGVILARNYRFMEFGAPREIYVKNVKLSTEKIPLPQKRQWDGFIIHRTLARNATMSVKLGHPKRSRSLAHLRVGGSARLELLSLAFR